MKITEYPTAQFFDADDVLIKDGTNGTKQIKASDLVYALFDPIPEMHGQIFRGKSLGSTFTTAQQQAISDGSFHDLWIGDYWESGDIKYRIVDFDYYPPMFDTATTATGGNLPHHIVVMPDTPIVKTGVQVHNSMTEANYVNWSFRSSSEMSQTKTAINGFFGSDKILTVYDYYCLAIATVAGLPYIDYRHNQPMTIEVPEIYMITDQSGAAMPGSWPGSGQFSLFRLCPIYRIASSDYENMTDDTNYSYFTRTISNSNGYTSSNEMYICNIGDSGSGNPYQATSSACTIRPYFCVRG